MEEKDIKELGKELESLQIQIDKLEGKAQSIRNQISKQSKEQKLNVLRNKLKDWNKDDKYSGIFYTVENVSYHNDPLVVFEVLSFDSDSCVGTLKRTNIHMDDYEYWTSIQIEKFSSNFSEFVSSNKLSKDKYDKFMTILMNPSINISQLEKEIFKIHSEK